MKDYEGEVKSKTLTLNNDKLCDRKVDNLAGPGSFWGRAWAASVRRGGGSGPLQAASPGDPGLAGVDITLQFVSINVFGMKSKLKFPDFGHFIQNYDIIGVNETKLDNYDTLEIDGLSIFICIESLNQRTSGPVNAHLISWPIKAQNI